MLTGEEALPSNIIRPAWKLITGKAAAFRDGQIGWSEVQNKPGGFADGVDDIGYSTGLQSGYGISGVGDGGFGVGNFPANVEVRFSLVPDPATPSLDISVSAVRVKRQPSGSLYYTLSVKSYSASQTNFSVRTSVLGPAMSQAALASIVRKAQKTAQPAVKRARN